jgi:hypothetical protein
VGTCSAETGTWAVLEGWQYPENGGGIIAHVQLQLSNGPRDMSIELANASPDVAYVDGQEFARSRSFAGNC